MQTKQQAEPKVETYGDPIRFRLAAEFWRIVDDLQPRILAALEYLTERRTIDEAWRQTINDLGVESLDLKYSILGFRNLLSKEDAESVRSYEECYKLAMKREGRGEVQHGAMEGRAELYARQRLNLEDRAIALFYQTMDIRAVAFKNKMWDFAHRPQTKAHGNELS